MFVFHQALILSAEQGIDIYKSDFMFPLIEAISCLKYHQI